MKRLLFCLPVMIAILPSRAQALSSADILVWSPPLEIADSASGNDPVFTWRHALPAGETLLEAMLDITHGGNAADGPVREIWTLDFGEAGTFVLGESAGGPRTETLDVTAEAGRALGLGLDFLEFRLTERTPYNGEKMELASSRLRFGLKEHRAPAAPEPSGAALGLIALAGAAWRKKKGPRP